MTQNMPNGTGPRVVIVGGGVAGLSAAWHAAMLGARSVDVLERTFIAAGSSGLSAGIFNRQTFDEKDLQLRVESGKQFAALEAATDFRVNRVGYMRLVRSADQWDRVRATMESGKYIDTELIDAEVVVRLVPGMRVDDVVGAMYGAEDGFVDGPELCSAFLQVGQARGVTLHTNTELTSADFSSGEATLETTKGAFTADVVINAAGSWLSAVGDILGAPVPIDNQLHEIVMFVVPSLEDEPVPTVQTYFPGSGEEAVYIRPDGKGRFLVGLHSYESTSESVAPGTSTRAVNNNTLDILAERLLDRFPEWEAAGIESGWSGIYPLSPDGDFIIGPSNDNPQVITLGALGGVGVTVSGAVGQLAAEWAVLGEGRVSDYADTFLPDRFERQDAR